MHPTVLTPVISLQGIIKIATSKRSVIYLTLRNSIGREFSPGFYIKKFSISCELMQSKVLPIYT